MKKKLVRITTVPLSLDKLLPGQLRFMSQHYQVTAVSSEPDYLRRIGEREGVAVHHIEMTREITPLADFKSLVNLIAFLRKHKPFIVHTHTPKAGIIGMLAAKIAGVPVRLHTVAGLPLLEESGTKRKILDAVEKLTYSCATKVYPNSFGLRDIIIENRLCDKNKLSVLANGSSNGIDTAYFSRDNFDLQTLSGIRLQANISSNETVFIFVGRLVKDKGINELVGAFARLSDQNANVRLVLVGAMEADLDPLEARTVEIMQSHPKIFMAGFQPDVRPWLAVSDVLAFPSYREGFPNVVMQAGAMGLASIVSNINGCNEIIVEGENGAIIPVKDEAALYEKMLKFASDDELRLQMQQKSREMIESRYSQQKVWDAILAEYRKFDV